MFDKIAFDYRTIRAFQVCVVFVATLALQRWLQYAHSAWIGFAVMMIYAGFDSGTSLHRTQHRFWGAIFGLLLSYVLWFIMRVHYELIFLVIPCLVFMTFFSLGKFYATPTIFTVSLTALGIDYYTIDGYHVSEFFFDYFRSTLLAFSICIFFEYFIFKEKNLTRQFQTDLQKNLIAQLDALFNIVTTYPVRRSQYLKLSTHLDASILEWRSFFIALKHDYHVKNKEENTRQFNELVDKVYQHIRQLFILEGDHASQLNEEVKRMLNHLRQLS
jgi:hypothetical protein